MALLAGLLAYALLGRSRFALVSATSSSAAVPGAATLSLAGHDAALRAALAAGRVLATGAACVAAGAMRLGVICSAISKPVLRGFSLGPAHGVAVVGRIDLAPGRQSSTRLEAGSVDDAVRSIARARGPHAAATNMCLHASRGPGGTRDCLFSEVVFNVLENIK
jgi:hypothetical protein